MSSWDWTVSSAKWAAVAVLGGASVAGLAWSMSRPAPAAIVRSPAVDSRTAEPVTSTSGAAPMPADSPPNPAPSTPREEVQASEPKPTAPESIPEPSSERDLRVHRINLNAATQAELELLPGIGPTMAKRILDYRAAKGRFSSIEELDKVKGIGEKTMAKIRPLVRVE